MLEKMVNLELKRKNNNASNKKTYNEGLNLIGPIPADTAFTEKYIKEY